MPAETSSPWNRFLARFEQRYKLGGAALYDAGQVRGMLTQATRRSAVHARGALAEALEAIGETEAAGAVRGVETADLVDGLDLCDEALAREAF